MKQSPDAEPATLPTPARRPRFWVAPLLVGTCFSLGFGITKRVVILQVNAEQPQRIVFAPAQFPGRALDQLRELYGGTAGDLQVDVSTLPVIEPEPLDATTLAIPEPAVEAALAPAQPAWTQPVWTEEPAPAIEPDPVLEPVVEDPLPLVPESVVLGEPAPEAVVTEEPSPPDSFFAPVEAPPVVIPEL